MDMIGELIELPHLQVMVILVDAVQVMVADDHVPLVLHRVGDNAIELSHAQGFYLDAQDLVPCRDGRRNDCPQPLGGHSESSPLARVSFSDTDRADLREVSEAGTKGHSDWRSRRNI